MPCLAATSAGPYGFIFSTVYSTRTGPGVADELEHVAVAADDVDRAGLAGAERAEDVVGLVALRADDGDAEGVEHLEQHGDLRRERLGLGLGAALERPVLLVRRDGGDPERRPPVEVEAGDQPGRSGVADDPGDEVEEAADGVDRLALRAGDRLGDAVEGAVPEGGRVEERQLSGHGRHGRRSGAGTTRVAAPLRPVRQTVKRADQAGELLAHLRELGRGALAVDDTVRRRLGRLRHPDDVRGDLGASRWRPPRRCATSRSSSRSAPRPRWRSSSGSR